MIYLLILFLRQEIYLPVVFFFFFLLFFFLGKKTHITDSYQGLESKIVRCFFR